MFGIGPDSEQYRAQGMIDPRAAAWSQGLQNIVQMNMGQAPTNDPFSAYQRQVMANTTTRLSEEQERRRAEAEKRADPYYEYTQGKERGILPEDMTWQQFNQAKFSSGFGSSNMRDMAQLEHMRRPQEEGETNDQYKQRLANADIFANVISKPFMIDTGGGGKQVVSALEPGRYPTDSGGPGVPGSGGQGAPNGFVVSPEDATQREADLAGAKEDATKWAAADQAWETAYGGAYDELTGAAKETLGLIKYIQANPDMDTGMLEGYISPRINEMVAYMDTLSTLLTVPALKEAKLNPVTEQEFQTIKDTFASAMKDPKANIGSLVANYNRMADAIERMQNVQKYYLENNRTTKGYGAQRGSNEPAPERLPVPGSAPAGSGGGANNGMIEIDGVD